MTRVAAARRIIPSVARDPARSLATLVFAQPQRHQHPVRHPSQDRHLARGERPAGHDAAPVAERPVAVARVVEVDRLERPVPVGERRFDLGRRAPEARRRSGRRVSGPKPRATASTTATACDTFIVGKSGRVGRRRHAEARASSSSVRPLRSGPKTNAARASRHARPGRPEAPTSASDRVLPRARSDEVATTTGTSATAAGRSGNRSIEASRSSAPEARRDDSSSGATPGSTTRSRPIPKFLATRAAEPRFEAFWGRTRTRARRSGEASKDDSLRFGRSGRESPVDSRPYNLWVKRAPRPPPRSSSPLAGPGPGRSQTARGAADLQRERGRRVRDAARPRHRQERPVRRRAPQGGLRPEGRGPQVPVDTFDRDEARAGLVRVPRRHLGQHGRRRQARERQETRSGRSSGHASPATTSLSSPSPRARCAWSQDFSADPSNLLRRARRPRGLGPDGALRRGGRHARAG